MADDESRILTIEEVAERLRRSEATLRYWRHLSTVQGRQVGPRSFKIGRGIVYKEADVLDWIQAQYASDAAS